MRRFIERRVRARGALRVRAFSLIEIMISSALFFVGLCAVLTTWNVATKLLNHHRHITRAVSLAEGTLEELVQRYPGDENLDIGHHGDRLYDLNAVLTDSNATYTVSWDVVPFEALEGMRAVTVTVAWQERDGQRTLKLTTWRS